MDLGAGIDVGPYRLDSILGQGGMGVVYRAHDTKLNRTVALKVLSSSLADAAARQRFQREAQTASSLSHPHIIVVHDAGEFDGRQYLVTELAAGGTLADWAERQTRTSREIVELLIGIADALATAHEAGILHRDIKPGNILLTKNGYAKLADFGLAKIPETPEDVTRAASLRTAVGAVVGTTAYMSPEQAAARRVDFRSDIFSFGMVLYQLVAGRRPFSGESDVDLLHAILHDAPPTLPDTVPAALKLLVEKTLEKDPADRYQTMREIVVDMRRLLRQSGESVQAPIAPARSSPRYLWQLAAAIVLLGLGAGVVLLVRGKTTAVTHFGTRRSRISPIPWLLPRFRPMEECLPSYAARTPSTVRARCTSSCCLTVSRRRSPTTVSTRWASSSSRRMVPGSSTVSARSIRGSCQCSVAGRRRCLPTRVR